jgi:hypothetical protein
MSNLISVPSLVYHQENKEEFDETPIEIQYYSSGINLVQKDNEIYIDDKHVKHLFKTILKNWPEAQTFLKQ